MDKLFNNHWFLKFVSLLIAFMLFMMVNMDDINNQPGVLPTVNEGTYTLEDVELTADYDEENYEIVEMSESVDVNLSGPQSALRLFQIARPSYDVYVDLEGRGAGVHHVNIQHRGFPAELGVAIVPEFVRVELEEKQTSSFPVNVEVENEDELENGYNLGDVTAVPEEVEVTAGESILETVEDVHAFVDVSEADESFDEQAEVVVYGEYGNELDVDVTPEEVHVEVEVDSPSVTVPVNLTREGELEDGLSIESLNYDPTEVTLYGPDDVLDEISMVDGVVLDLEEINGDETVELDIQAPPQVDRVEPETVEVDIEVVEAEERTFSGLPIDMGALADETFSVLSPTDRAVDVTVTGAADVLQGMDRNDVNVYIEPEESLENGELELPLRLDTLPNVEYELDPDTIEVQVASEETNDED
ncbi:CdaR family protein [Salsuginibacillus kocurii]|uniref:CdaR family protein n=1 Tax=Salsuginibacillus kocurii TaxID=427078 RepID=UPI00037056D0|nr:CdaR family protein [Salsuginibacillus kocurii]